MSSARKMVRSISSTKSIRPTLAVTSTQTGTRKSLKKGEPQKQLSKEFVRQWLIDHNFMGKEGQQVPEMTDEYVNSVSDRYIELYEHIVGQKFNKADNHDDLAARIEKNVTEYLNQK